MNSGHQMYTDSVTLIKYLLVMRNLKLKNMYMSLHIYNFQRIYLSSVFTK
jgi:hypothetical protein